MCICRDRSKRDDSHLLWYPSKYYYYLVCGEGLPSLHTLGTDQCGPARGWMEGSHFHGLGPKLQDDVWFSRLSISLGHKERRSRGYRKQSSFRPNLYPPGICPAAESSEAKTFLLQSDEALQWQ